MAAKQDNWPIWWEWELEFSSELPDRMVDRGFTEADLRLMLQEAFEWEVDKEPGRFLVRTRWDGDVWEIPVEPDWETQRLVIITAYRVE